MSELILFRDQKALVTAADAFEDQASQVQRGQSYAKFTKDGRYVYGAEEQQVDPDEEWAVNITAISRGWICWVNNKPVDERLVPISSGRDVQFDELPDHGPYSGNDGWRRQFAVQLRSLETGDQIVFKTASKGGEKAIGGLSGEIGKRLRISQPGDPLIPIVRLRAESYRHQQYGKIWNPVIDIVRWATEAELVGNEAEPEGDDEPPFESAPPPAPAPKPAARQRRDVRA